ncbi:MAG: pyrroline-5-carboxylate reductase [Chloroflexota bacterium]|nr:pyrroline-5-carboxylate reductase [Chloroflexota bacterium]
MIRKLAVVGGGAMGEALLAAAIAQDVCPSDAISVGEPVASRRAHLAETHGVGVDSDNAKVVSGADVVILAVKPQQIQEALPPLREVLSPDALVISIMAGPQLGTIGALLNHGRLVRAMPSILATIGEAATVWTASAETTAEQRAQAQALFQAAGLELAVPDEHYLDMATAVNGSGPGFVFLLLEALIDGAVRVGLPRDTAAVLIIQTVKGSALMAQNQEEHLAALRNLVTSPGGTTAAGLQALEAGGVRATLQDAVMAAYRRSQELAAPDSGQH